jgi:hypothetical protein
MDRIARGDPAQLRHLGKRLSAALVRPLNVWVLHSLLILRPDPGGARAPALAAHQTLLFSTESW